MRAFSLPSLALLIGISVAVPAAAEQMEMPAEGSPSPAMAMDMPAMGLTMDQVRQRYGKPVEVKPAVGEPPITRWIYDGYTVYFEHSTVIHSVATR